MRTAIATPIKLPGIVLSLLLVAAFAPQTVQAQSWSSQEQEAIDHLRVCWSAWAEEDYDAWAQVCSLDPSGSYWDTAELAPSSMDAQGHYLRAVVLQGYADADVVAWDVRPVSVTSWGDVVGVYFFGVLHLRDSEGTVTLIQDRRFEILRKVDGRWSVVGGMSALDPSSN
jgi:hypothetical protein